MVRSVQQFWDRFLCHAIGIILDAAEDETQSVAQNLWLDVTASLFFLTDSQHQITTHRVRRLPTSLHLPAHQHTEVRVRAIWLNSRRQWWANHFCWEYVLLMLHTRTRRRCHNLGHWREVPMLRLIGRMHTPLHGIEPRFTCLSRWRRSTQTHTPPRLRRTLVLRRPTKPQTSRVFRICTVRIAIHGMAILIGVICSRSVHRPLFPAICQAHLVMMTANSCHQLWRPPWMYIRAICMTGPSAACKRRHPFHMHVMYDPRLLGYLRQRPR